MAKQPGPIHDKFSSYCADLPDIVNQFFSEHLPKSWSSQIVSQRPELIHGKFTDERIDQHQTDALYKVKLTSGETGFVYILADHKSSPDYDISLQLLRYMARIYERHTQQKNWKPLPEIWPIVLYHGLKNWTIPTNFASLYGQEQKPKTPNILDFEYHLVDLTKIPDNELSANQRLRVFLMVQKHILRSDFFSAMNTVLAELKYLKEVDITAILNYIILKHGEKMDQSTIDGILVEIASDKKDRIMAGITQEWMQEGLEKGKMLGEANMLVRLLSKRFGTLPDSIKDKITNATSDKIQLWEDRFIDAPSLEEVFK